MTLPYLLRLLCLCFAFFFLSNAAVALFIAAFSKSLVRFAEIRRAASAARIVLALRLVPFAFAAVFVGFLCVPSYVNLEPSATAEYVSLPCLLLGLLGLTTLFLALLRSARAVLDSFRHHHRLGEAVQLQVAGSSSSVAVLECDRPLLALSGLLQPRLLISRGILKVLSARELEAALAHEHAHCASRDNWKRLVLLLAPDAFPFWNVLAGLQQQWAKFAEWAADDQATAGNSARAVSLAEALVNAARLGTAPSLPDLATSLLASDQDLHARVDRLLRPQNEAASLDLRFHVALRAGGASLAIAFLTLLSTPAPLRIVHELQEFLLR